MPQKTSPFIEGKYGWNLGESGWNGGMDENLVKFSYLFDRNIDQIVSSLPPEVNGKAYFNTTDNRIYYVVDGTYSSTPTPKWFELKLRATGETYQYNGSSLVAVQSTSELEQELNDRIDTTDSNVSQVASDLSDLDTALKDGTNPNNGSAYLAKASVALPSIQSLLTAKQDSSLLYGCGSESNGRSGFAALSSTALGSNKPLLVNGFLAFNNNTANGGFPNAIYVQAQNSVANTVVARGCYSHDPANATTDATVDGIGAYLVDEYNEFPNGVASTNGGYIHHVAKTAVVRSLSVTTATNVIELQSTQGGQTSFSGEVLVTASNVQPSNTRVGNIATYKLLVNKDSAGSTVVEVSKIGQTTGATAASPSFTWTMSGNFLRATPVASTTGTFFFEVMTQGPVKVKV